MGLVGPELASPGEEREARLLAFSARRNRRASDLGCTAAMMMETLRLMEKQYDVVLGPCPGCQLWQLDYTYAAAQTYATVSTEETREFGADRPLMVSVVDSSGFHEAVEDALTAHLEECPHLQRALFDFG